MPTVTVLEHCTPVVLMRIAKLAKLVLLHRNE